MSVGYNRSIALIPLSHFVSYDRLRYLGFLIATLFLDFSDAL
jgi:hypothetical protein